ncbi:hypothetical protein C1646_813974 [Rhizophagus diaphanus]|nr:hypothetical protein C1646_813974 [Rhizophagus diaphanus] [Rhizophagus sp. MUCL 43196]
MSSTRSIFIAFDMPQETSFARADIKRRIIPEEPGVTLSSEDINSIRVTQKGKTSSIIASSVIERRIIPKEPGVTLPSEDINSIGVTQKRKTSSIIASSVIRPVIENVDTFTQTNDETNISQPLKDEPIPDVSKYNFLVLFFCSQPKSLSKAENISKEIADLRLHGDELTKYHLEKEKQKQKDEKLSRAKKTYRKYISTSPLFKKVSPPCIAYEFHLPGSEAWFCSIRNKYLHYERKVYKEARRDERERANHIEQEDLAQNLTTNVRESARWELIELPSKFKKSIRDYYTEKEQYESDISDDTTCIENRLHKQNTSNISNTYILSESQPPKRTRLLEKNIINEVEAAVRLIQEDRDIIAEKARKIMLKSVRFGEYIHIMNLRVMCRLQRFRDF